MPSFFVRAVGRARRMPVIAIVAGSLLVATAVVVPVALSATVQPTIAAPSAYAREEHPSTNPLGMGSYPSSSFAAAAAKLPRGLTTALRRDVHLTAAQYLANSAAAVQGVKVVATLKSDGVHVLGSKMNGTELVVNVSSAADVPAVELLGANAVIGAPETKDYSKIPFKAVSSTATYGGEGYFFQEAGQTDGNGIRCSIGFNGYAVSTGSPEFTTAGHCETTIPANGPVYQLTETAPVPPGGNAGSLGAQLGTGVAGTYGAPTPSDGSGEDYGIISSAGTQSSPVTPQTSVATWSGGSTAAPLSSAPLGVTGETAGIANATLCKSGSSSGWTCGTILSVDQTVEVSNEPVNAIVATTCIIPGDSGGAALIGSNAVGIDSGGTFGTSCSNSGANSVFFPMVSAAGNDSVTGQQGSNWQLGLSLAAPAVTYPGANAIALVGRSLKGTLANAPVGSTVSLYMDGSSTAFASGSVTIAGSATTGSWSIPLTGLSAGSHTYSLVAKSGWSVGTPGTGSFTVTAPVPPAVSGGVGDFDGDGNSDVVVRDGNGTLFLYPGNGGTGFLPRVQLSAYGAWASMTAIVAAGDLNGDGNQDIVARDAQGNLWLYPGNGSNGFGARIQLSPSTDWLAMTSIQGVGDFNGDGHADLVARDSSGNLLLFPGNGTSTNTLGAPITIAAGWGSFTGIMGIGDFDGDGKSDILARDASGALWLYPGLGSATTAVNGASGGGFGPRGQVGGGWQGITIQAIGDFDNDGHEDIFVRDANGALFLYPGTGNTSSPFRARIQVGGGWEGLTIAGDASSIPAVAPPVPAAVSGGVGDFNSDGNSDVVVRDGNGTLFLYPGNGGTGFLTRVQLSATGAWAGMTAIVAAGDLNGDGHPDIVARDHAGTLWLYPGNGSTALGTPEQLGATGAFMGMTAIQGVGDLNGDGHADLIARDTSGNLWLYPGNGTSTNTLGSPTVLASGWGSFTGIMGIGDFDGDGKADVLARDAAGALWLYPGLGTATGTGASGTPGFGPRVQVGGGWEGITIQAIGDFNNDGHEDIFVRDANGALWLYPGTGVASSPFLPRIQVGGGWEGLTIAGDAASIPPIVPPVPAAVSGGVGDFNGDGNSDVVVRDGNGTLFLYPGNGGTGFLPRTALSTPGAWAGMTAIVAAGDLDGDGHPDIVARDGAGTLFLYRGNGSTGFIGNPVQLGATGQFAGMTAIQGASDFNGDGKADLVMRDSSGNLWLYPGPVNVNTGAFGGTPITIATGWGSYTGIMGIGDFDGDGKADILARDASGNLWLYPGLGSATTAVNGDTGGGFGPRVQVGGGWQGITIQAIGDFNNDGHEDIFVRDANGALWLYPGTGVASNPFLPRIQVGGGWEGLTIAGDAATIPAIAPAG